MMRSLRDEIAIEAMKVLIQEGSTLKVHTEDGILELPRSKAVPRLAYEYADNMLKFRGEEDT